MFAFLQPSVPKKKIFYATMAHGCKGFFPFGTVTDSCEEANFMVFSHDIFENDRTSENINLEKRANFIFYSSKYIPRILNLV